MTNLLNIMFIGKKQNKKNLQILQHTEKKSFIGQNSIM